MAENQTTASTENKTNEEQKPSAEKRVAKSGDILKRKNISNKTLYLTHGAIKSGDTGKVTRAESKNLFSVLEKG